MASYLGFICNKGKPEKLPANVTLASHVRVRIPQLHGNPDNLEGALYFTDDQLPWARTQNYLGSPDKGFNAEEYYVDGSVVRVIALNNDLTNLIIDGVFGNYTYTSDTTQVGARRACLVGSTNGNAPPITASATIATSIVQKALAECTNPPISDKGTNDIKYIKDFYGDESHGTITNWDCIFIWWIFNACKLSNYFYGGNKTTESLALYNHHKQRGESISSGYKSGDILFMNLSGGSSITHVEIAVEDEDLSKNTILCVGGCNKNSSGHGEVNKNTRSLDHILYGVRPGTERCVNRNDPNWKQYGQSWSGYKLVKQTIKDVGCAMVSLAILLRMTGLTTTGFDPGVLNDYLKTNNGYDNNDCLKWGAANGYVSGWAYRSSKTLTGQNPTKLTEIKKLLDEGYYVIAVVKNGGHYVAITGYAADELLMSDPGSASTHLFEKYGTLNGCYYYACMNKFEMS